MIPRPLVLALPLLVLAGCPPHAPDASEAAGAEASAEPSEASPESPVHARVLFTSAGWGELQPCHCPNERLGGLARRAAVVAEARAGGPVLAVDAGDTVFAVPTVDPGDAGDAARERGRTLLEAFGHMGYAALAVGPKDLAAGADWLTREAEAAGVPLLSVNLRTGAGEAAFPSHRVVSLGARRVALVGVASPEDAPAYRSAGLTVADPKASLQAVVDALPGGIDRVIVLGTLDSSTVRRLAEAVPEVDLVLTAGNGHLTRRPETAGGALVYEAGVRGQHLLDLQLELSGTGPLVDAGRRSAAESAAEALAARVAHLEGLQAEEPGGRPDLSHTLRTTRAQLERARDALDRPSGGRVEARLVRLTLDRPRDPEVAALVDAVADPAEDDGAVCTTGTCGEAG